MLSQMPVFPNDAKHFGLRQSPAAFHSLPLLSIRLRQGRSSRGLHFSARFFEVAQESWIGSHLADDGPGEDAPGVNIGRVMPCDFDSVPANLAADRQEALLFFRKKIGQRERQDS